MAPDASNFSAGPLNRPAVAAAGGIGGLSRQPLLANSGSSAMYTPSQPLPFGMADETGPAYPMAPPSGAELWQGRGQSTATFSATDVAGSANQQQRGFMWPSDASQLDPDPQVRVSLSASSLIA